MADYYFLASLLPELEIGHIPPLGFSELKELLRINLTKEDKLKVQKFLRLIDIENMRLLWAKEPLDPRGNLTQEELERALMERSWPDNEPFPEYLDEFLDHYKTDEERLSHFSFLMGQFLEDQSLENEGFLAAFFHYERYLRLVVAGFRAKKWGKNVAAELQFEDESDPIVAQIIAQKDAKTYEPPFEFKELKPIFEYFSDEPFELHKALTEQRFNTVQDLMGNAHFSIDRILGYMAELWLVEKWLELDVQQGINVVDKIEGYIQ